MNIRYRSLLAGFFVFLFALVVAAVAPAAETVHLTEDQQTVIRVAHVVPLPGWLTKVDRDLLKGAARLLQQNKLDVLQKDWRSMVQTWVAGDRHSDEIDVLGTWILREGLLVPNANLFDKARQVGDTHELLKVQRAGISGLREASRKLPDGGSATTSVHVKGVKNGKAFDDGVRQLSGAQIASLQKDMEVELERLTQMSQMQQLDLQNALSKQQQVLQMLSNVSKMLNDTLKAIIQNKR